MVAGLPLRGVGTVHADVSGRSGSFEARWGSSGESLVVIGYAGPLRVLDASLLGDSLFVGIRRDEFGVTGTLRADRGTAPEAIRFLLRPWDFSAPWIREALERAAVEPAGTGWRLRGEGTPTTGPVAFLLDLDARGNPTSLELSRARDRAPLARVRYGALRGYGAGRFPRWIEWSRGGARVRFDPRDIDPLPGERLRLLPPAPAEWRVVGLDDPDGRSLLARLLGDSPGADAR